MERPCTPAPITRYFADAGRVIVVTSVDCRYGNAIAISRHSIPERGRKRERMGAKERHGRVLRAHPEAGVGPLDAQDRDQLPGVAEDRDRDRVQVGLTLP